MITLRLGADSVDIPNPQLGNKRSFDPSRIIKSSRGGEALIAQPNGRAQFYGYEWSFLAIKDDDLDSLVTFIDDNAGQTIEVDDFSGETFSAVIPDPVIAITENLTANSHSFTLRLLSTELPSIKDYLLLEDGTYVLLEDGQRIELE